MNIRLFFTIIISKLSIKVCRLLKRGGTTLPGKIALKIYPAAARLLAKRFKIIMVTGTNGKTTTTRIISQILKENNISYITNKSGANLVSGIVTTLLENVGITGRCNASTALLEIDEAAFKRITSHMQPDIVVVTNFFRDQLDRYGELYSTLASVRTGLEKTTDTHLVLNADDSLCSTLGKDFKNEIIYYGFGEDAYKGLDETVNSDAAFCIYCKNRYEYQYITYGHLGAFNCPVCGYHRPETGVTCTKVKELTSAHSVVDITLDEATVEAEVRLPGLYNVYNALAAVACGQALHLPVENSLKALQNFECGFGRMETIATDDGKYLKVILVKNPTGFNQVLNYLITEAAGFQVAFIINDKLADGTDISWLWDVEFENLKYVDDRLLFAYTSGTRAEDMAVRLKYAGVPCDRIGILHDHVQLIDRVLAATPAGSSLYILPTYTSMLEIRSILQAKFNLKEFWK